MALSLWPHHFLLKVTSILLIFLLNINVFIFGDLELESFVLSLWESFGGLLFGFEVTLIFKRFFFLDWFWFCWGQAHADSKDSVWDLVKK